MFTHTYWDHGTKIGETYNHEEAVAFLVEQENSHSPWTAEEASKALRQAVREGTTVTVDYNGDGFEELIPC